MQNTITKNGNVTFRFNLQGEKLYSPDGLSHCLPCERCGDPQWVSLPTCSVLCERCAVHYHFGHDEPVAGTVCQECSE